jgi:hypothetical protein
VCLGTKVPSISNSIRPRTAGELRQRAAEYRKAAEDDADPEMAAALRKIADAYEQAADNLESAKAQA